LVGLSAFFSACETALTGVNRIRLKHKAENGSTPAKKALYLLKKYDRILATLLIGNNTVNLVAASIATVLAVHAAMSSGKDEALTVGIVTGIITAVLIIVGDILPKTLAREHSESFILATADVLTALMWILRPVSAVMLLLQNGLSRIFRKSKKEVSVTEEELMQIIDEIEGEGVLEEHESDLVRSALEFDETTVEEILTPRVNITAVELNDCIERVRDVFFDEGYSRLPVYDKTPDKIVGVISNKDFMKRLLSGDEFKVKDIMHDIEKLPAMIKLSDALKFMQREKSHLAVVIDQHGGTEGIVALEDILEELVGEIWDESDEETQPVKFLNSTVFEIGGELSINDFNRSFENMEKDEISIDFDGNTVGGWIFKLIERIPETGEKIETEKFRITVLNMLGRKIEKLRFEIKSN
jgi:CBS domain containing-hemolysin-like protein